MQTSGRASRRASIRLGPIASASASFRATAVRESELLTRGSWGDARPSPELRVPAALASFVGVSYGKESIMGSGPFGGLLASLTRAHHARSGRVSSWDHSGRNQDYWII